MLILHPYLITKFSRLETPEKQAFSFDAKIQTPFIQCHSLADSVDDPQTKTLGY